MDKIDIKFNTSCFGSTTNGLYLTKVSHFPENNVIMVTYHNFDNGIPGDTKVVKLEDNYENFHRILEDRYKSMIKVIECNDKDLYGKIQILEEKIRNYNIRCGISNTISIISSIVTLALGYYMVTSNSSELTLGIAFSASFIVTIACLYYSVLSLENNETYEKDCKKLITTMEEKVSNYTRIRKKGE